MRPSSEAQLSAELATMASDHQRWPSSFQGPSRNARQPVLASNGPAVAGVVTAVDLPPTASCAPSLALAQAWLAVAQWGERQRPEPERSLGSTRLARNGLATSGLRPPALRMDTATRRPDPLGTYS